MIRCAPDRIPFAFSRQERGIPLSAPYRRFFAFFPGCRDKLRRVFVEFTLAAVRRCKSAPVVPPSDDFGVETEMTSLKA